MQHLKQNQIIKHKETEIEYPTEYKVIDWTTNRGLYAVQFVGASPIIWYTPEEIEAQFELPRERFQPKNGENYYRPMIVDGNVIPGEFIWFDAIYDTNSFYNNLVFRTREECEEAIRKMLEAIKE